MLQRFKGSQLSSANACPCYCPESEQVRGQRSHTSVSILSRFPTSLPLLSPTSFSRPCLTLSLPAPSPPSQVVFNWGGGADGRRTSAPLSLAALWWGEGWRWWWCGVGGVQRRVFLSFLLLSISNPAVVSNKHTPAHASEHTRSRARAGVFPLNWVLQCVQSKDEGKNTGVVRGERRTLQGEFDFHIILPAHTHTRTHTRHTHTYEHTCYPSQANK